MPSTPVSSTPPGGGPRCRPPRGRHLVVWARIAATSLARKLAVGQADDERHVLRAPTSRSPSPRCITRSRRRPRPAQRGADGVGEVARVGLLDHVGERLRVGLRRQRVAARRQAVAQLAEVLDDPVVDDRDLARAVLVRMAFRSSGGRGSPSACGRGRSPRAGSDPRSRSVGWRACPPSSRRTGRRPSSTRAIRPSRSRVTRGA